MLSIKTVLVPTDFSDASESALRYGKAMAEKFGATLHVVHVMEDLLAHAWAAEVYVSSMPQLRDEIEKESRLRLGALLTVAFGAFVLAPFQEEITGEPLEFLLLQIQQRAGLVQPQRGEAQLLRDVVAGAQPGQREGQRIERFRRGRLLAQPLFHIGPLSLDEMPGQVDP